MPVCRADAWRSWKPVKSKDQRNLSNIYLSCFRLEWIGVGKTTLRTCYGQQWIIHRGRKPEVLSKSQFQRDYFPQTGFLRWSHWAKLPVAQFAVRLLTDSTWNLGSCCIPDESLKNYGIDVFSDKILRFDCGQESDFWRLSGILPVLGLISVSPELY